MNRDEIKVGVEQIVREELCIAKQMGLRETTRIMEDLGADSLDVVELGMMVEQRFDLTISDSDMEKMKTVGDVIELVDHLLREREEREGEEK